MRWSPRGAAVAWGLAGLFLILGAGAWASPGAPGPVLVAIVVAARSGSAMAAELGTMKVTEQIDALRAMAVSDGMVSLLADGVDKALAGQTSLAEVIHAVGELASK